MNGVAPPERFGLVRQQVLMLPRHATSWAELSALAKILIQDARFTPVMVLANSYAGTLASECRSAGIQFVDVSGEIEDAFAAREAWFHGLLSRLESWCARHEQLGHFLPLSLLRMIHYRNRLKSEYSAFKRLVTDRAPVAIFVPGDRELSPIPAMLRVGLDCQVPTIIATATIPDPDGVVLMRQRSRSFRAQLLHGAPILNALVAQKYPEQVLGTAHGELMFSPGWRVLAMEGAKMRIQRPWIQGGGNSGYIFQCNLARLKSFIARGLSLEKCVAVGDYTLDPVFECYARRESIKAGITARYRFPSDRLLTVVAVPQDAEHLICDWDTHRARMRKFMGKLARPDLNTLLVLHPKSRPEDYKFLNQEFGLDIATERLSEALPAADIFVCGGSTTLMWSRLCGIPAINLHYLNLDVEDAKDRIAVREVETPEELTEAVNALRNQIASGRNAAIQEHAEQLRKETLFDGRTGQRIIAFLLCLARGERPVGPVLAEESWAAAIGVAMPSHKRPL